MATYRGELRTRIAGRLGDLTQLVATADGSTTSFVDTVRLSGQIEAPGNRDIVFTSTDNDFANIGQTRRITSYNLSSGTLNFAAVPVALEEDNTAELYNFRGRGWHKTEYDNAINQAITSAHPLYKKPTIGYVYDAWPATDQTSFDALTGIINFDDVHTADASEPMTHISGLSWEDQGGIWQPVEAALTNRGQGWTYDYALNVIDVRSGGIPNGSSVRIHGFTEHYQLTDDLDVVLINTEWLINRACQILCMGATDRDAANYNLGMVYGQNADRLKPSIRTRIPTGTVQVVV